MSARLAWDSGKGDSSAELQQQQSNLLRSPRTHLPGHGAVTVRGLNLSSRNMFHRSRQTFGENLDPGDLNYNPFPSNRALVKR